MLERLEWSDVRVFLEAARRGTLAAAGKALSVNTATIGRRLDALEETVGTRLFDRTPRGLTLTPAGERVLPFAQQMEGRALELAAEIEGEDTRLEGSLRITATDAFAVYNLLPFAAELHARHPKMRLEVVASHKALDLSRREADIAIRLLRPKEPALVARRAGTIVLCLYGSPGYLARQGKEVIGYAGEAAHWPEAGWIERHGTPSWLRVSTIPALHAAAQAGLGLAILPRFIADADPKLTRVSEPLRGLEREIWLVTHKSMAKNARVRAGLEFLSDTLRRQGL
ncbi:MAG: LysR family transcriptional regulator [Myxococcaceae bacterium]